MRRTESGITHNGTRFMWNTHDAGYPETKIKDGQRTTYGYNPDESDQQSVLTAMDTIMTIVAIWQTLKNASREWNWHNMEVNPRTIDLL